MIILLGALWFWGWMNAHWLAIAIMSMAIVLSRLISWRWALKLKQYYRVGDFVSLSVVAVLLMLVLIDTEKQTVFIVLEWLPLIFLPILLAQLYSVDKLLPMGILFYSQRKRTPIRYLDFKIPYTTICLLAAGASNDSSLRYFVGSSVLMIVLLWAGRSKNSSKVVWLSVMLLASVIAFSGQKGLQTLHSIVEEQAVEWFSDWETDPFRSMTSIGDIGHLKLSNKIEFRVKANEPLLLLEASYDRYLGKSWLASERIFTADSPFLMPDEPKKSQQLEVFQSRKRSTMLALPAGTVSILGLEGGTLQFTAFGAVKLTDAPDYVNFKVNYTGQAKGSVREFDLHIPEQHQHWINEIKQQLKLDGESKQQIAQGIKQFFQQHYYYSLFLGNESNADTALETFMLQRKAGHCEYFAVASTFLLRSYGIPARLANGYAMQEYSALEQLYIVRRRHAHAWSIAYINGVWQAVDATPSQWLELEEDEASIWEPVYDLFSSLYFNYKQWRYQQALSKENSDQNRLIVSVLFLVMIFIGGRLYKARKQFLKTKLKALNEFELSIDYFGMDSELYTIDKMLSQTEQARLNNESIYVWAKRLNNKPLLDIVILHYQYRFDTASLNAKHRDTLKVLVQQWLLDYQD